MCVFLCRLLPLFVTFFITQFFCLFVVCPFLIGCWYQSSNMNRSVLGILRCGNCIGYMDMDLWWWWAGASWLLTHFDICILWMSDVRQWKRYGQWPCAIHPKPVYIVQVAFVSSESELLLIIFCGKKNKRIYRIYALFHPIFSCPVPKTYSRVFKFKAIWWKQKQKGSYISLKSATFWTRKLKTWCRYLLTASPEKNREFSYWKK